MIRAIFLDISDGRMKRLAYFGYALLLDILGLLFVFGIVALIAGAEKAMGGDLLEAQAELRKAFSGPLVIVLLGVFALFVFASLNISAKRIRDIGLPGWQVVLAIAVATIAASMLISVNAGHTLSFVAWIVLLLTPSNLMNRG